MDLYKGLKLKQVKLLANEKFKLNMIGKEFTIIKINMNTIRLAGDDIVIEISDDIIDEYFQPIKNKDKKQLSDYSTQEIIDELKNRFTNGNKIILDNEF